MNCMNNNLAARDRFDAPDGPERRRATPELALPVDDYFRATCPREPMRRHGSQKPAIEFPSADEISVAARPGCRAIGPAAETAAGDLGARFENGSAPPRKGTAHGNRRKPASDDSYKGRAGLVMPVNRSLAADKLCCAAARGISRN